MVIFYDGVFGHEAERERHLDLVFGLVLAVASAPLRFNEMHRRHAVLPRKLVCVIDDAIFVQVFELLEFARCNLVVEYKFDAAVHDGLLFYRVLIKLERYVNVGKHVKVGFPADFRTGVAVFAVFRSESADVFSLFKVQSEFFSVAADRRVHIFRAVLRRACTQTVQTKTELVILSVVVLVFSAGVKLAEDKLPIEASLGGVKFDGHTASAVLILDRLVEIAAHRDDVSVPLTRLVDRV